MAKERYPYTNAANRYARDVFNGKVVACLHIKQACERHLNDIKRSKNASFVYKYIPELGEKICKFAELMPHIKGKWAGTTITLQPWQCFLLCSLFGWVKKKDGLRRFRKFYAEIPRKNSKSTIGAVIGNFMFSVDGEPGAEVYSGASDLKQANEVFRPAWKMTKKLPAYMAKYGVELGGTDKNPGNIYSLKNESRFEPVIGKPGDGASVHCGIVDEYHEHPTDAVYDCFLTGMGSRQQPLLAVITTAGTNTASPCYHQRNEAIKMLDGETEDNELFALIYTIDKEDDWTIFDNWIKANPNYGVSVFEDYLLSQYNNAIRDARKQNILKCKHLNIWSDAAEAFFNMLAFDKCKDIGLSIEDFKGHKAYIGLDLAAKKDLAALMILIKKNVDYYLFSQYYFPSIESIGEDKAHYTEWAKDGYITLTPGNRIDFSYIKEDLKKYAKFFDLSGEEQGGGEICNDPWNAQQLVSELENEGIAVTEISQTVNMLSEPLKELDAVICDGKFHHDGNPVTRWCFSNTMAKRDKKDNVFPFKQDDDKKIDGAVATVNAMCRAMVEKGDDDIILPTSLDDIDETEEIEGLEDTEDDEEGFDDEDI